MDFGKELLCKYISCSYEWADWLNVKLVGQLKGRMGLDSPESHRFQRSSGLDFEKFRKCHTIFQMKRCNSLLGSFMKDVDRLLHIARITGVTQCAISQILKKAQQAGSPKHMPVSHHQGFLHPGKTDTY